MPKLLSPLAAAEYPETGYRFPVPVLSTYEATEYRPHSSLGYQPPAPEALVMPAATAIQQICDHDHGTRSPLVTNVVAAIR